MYASSHLYINFFQPSFKLQSKTRDGARVHKVCFTPATPCDRLPAHSSVGPAIRQRLTAPFMGLGPVRLLQEIRLSQQTLSDLAAHGVSEDVAAGTPAIADFVASKAQPRTLQRQVKAWRAERAQDKILGRLRVPDAMPVEV
ncbi:hypothetical protein [Roseateles sp.]|uniref:hypothetical protein n=1 Tax=Roseateles sp. TaxID=1971397 RepID=UPI003BA55518